VQRFFFGARECHFELKPVSCRAVAAEIDGGVEGYFLLINWTSQLDGRENL
jgi:hypothetical protein